MATMTLEVRGMHCPGCAARLGKVVGLQPGVTRASADFLGGLVAVEAGEGVDRASIAAAVTEAGFIAGAWRDEAGLSGPSTAP